jgi:hypothetical protein
MLRQKIKRFLCNLSNGNGNSNKSDDMHLFEKIMCFSCGVTLSSWANKYENRKKYSGY